MTHPAGDVALVQSLHAAGLNQSEIARATGISRSSVGEWIRHGRSPESVDNVHEASICGLISCVPRPDYAYLLGLYLGDGCLSAYPRGVYRLRISCCDAYPVLMDLCQKSMERVLPNRVCRVPLGGCTEVGAYSKHWPCLFPQHGPGRKHERPIVLVSWQLSIVAEHPKDLLRGLIHSDGCRSDNWVGGRPYSRYTFTNVSDDIRGIFCDTCDLLGIEWRRMNARNISVAKRSSVELMDTFIGPKT